MRMTTEQITKLRDGYARIAESKVAPDSVRERNADLRDLLDEVLMGRINKEVEVDQ